MENPALLTLLFHVWHHREGLHVAGGNRKMPGQFGKGCGCQTERLDAGRITRELQSTEYTGAGGRASPWVPGAGG